MLSSVMFTLSLLGDTPSTFIFLQLGLKNEYKRFLSDKSML